MKRIIFLLIFSVHFTASLIAQQNGIQFFEGTWNQALQKAKKENKPIFLDCAADWCGPCKRLAKNVFSQKELGDYYNTHFVNVAMDMEKGEGMKLRKTFDVDIYPTLIVINPDGYRIIQIKGAGAKTADDLIAWGDSGLNNMGTMPLQQRFDNGQRGDDFVTEFCTDFVRAGLKNKVDTVLQKIVNESSYSALYKSTYYQMLPVLDIDSPLSLYFFKNRKKFEKLYTEDDVNGKISDMYFDIWLLYNRLYEAGPPHRFMKKAYDSYLQTIKSRNLPDMPFLKAQLDFFVACRKGEFEKAIALGDSALKHAGAWQHYALAKMGNHLLQKGDRLKIVAWAEGAARLSKNDKVKKDCGLIINQLKTLQQKPYMLNEGISNFTFN